MTAASAAGYAERVLAVLGVAYSRVLLARFNGSRGHGSDDAESDVDVYIVYAPSTEEVLVAGLEASVAPPDTLTTSIEAGAGPGIEKTTDVALYEVGKFLALLRAGSPLAVETVFAPSEDVYVDPLLAPVLEMRDEVLTRKAFRSLLGHTSSEFKQIELAEARGVGWSKLLYHAQRLMLEVEAVYSGGRPQVKFSGETLAALMATKQGKLGGAGEAALLEKLRSRHQQLQRDDPTPAHLPQALPVNNS
ncbi:uncharacterized protein AMSG_08265 [Thecamonas trahens ATCC 50062]|uniref:Polymerase nucleotidyl transferase domain-containing protein n=1 Tax=Thecamonas trahens ATCC 50062 TaxID=461836 RepID=A0A0L0DI75_THETB|nr:hypothetical protein AMSG_08265 [Thecamonas trahens ATCC 50062]KNC52012.1 hypothetical protein AMSG_08265 [Thecamonas trahens ATCC 50062]|eukprot:XP_013755595.1 hypothetical protein AMSG_08265 [Thecamonas trahens ATCC 50062]